MTITSSSFSSCCIVIMEYPAVNMPTALCLASKSKILVVAQIYACERLQVRFILIFACMYV